MHFYRHTSPTPDLRNLIKRLDADLAIRDGEDHAFYNQFNGLENIRHLMIAYQNTVPLACGAFKKYDSKRAEIKRMFVVEESRGKGIGAQLLKELEKWAYEEGYRKTILETGINQPEAIRLYEKMGYHRIDNFGPYEDADASFCFEKDL